MNSDVTVQVVCVTYNQKDYIKDALDSFLMQKTNFKFEVLVGDDCSTDGTTEIVAEYAKKYPDIIKHIHRETNMGCLANFMDLCESITAPYAAFCDGDDYWTDENKLQKQFDFMEKNEDVNICAHRIFLKGADNNWGLYKWYKNKKEPFIIPQKENTKINKKIMINDLSKEWLQMSALFIRWKKLTYPQWAKEGTIGDMTIQYLQLADKYMYVFEEVMSVWRQGVKSVFADSSNVDLHFVKTRSEYIKIIYNTINYFKENYPNCPIDNFDSRLWTEIINYTNAIINTDRWDLLLDLKEKYPDVYTKVKGLLREYKYRLQQINKLGLNQANLLRRNSTLRLIRPVLKILNIVKNIVKNISSAVKLLHSFLTYWLFALVPKKKNLWVFSGFNKKNYMDNTKYLYEYIVENHPEIEAVWLTRSKEVRKSLKETKMPVHRMNSPIGIWTTARAKVAFSDHLKMSDYDNRYGFNAGTKFVQLWHGVGLKGSVPVGDKIPNTQVPGVRLSSDIIAKDGDSIFTKFIKRLKYMFIAPNRELMEEYYILLCPGQHFADIFANPWRIPEKAQLRCGMPRHINLYKPVEAETLKIIYAPTYRWKTDVESELVDNFINNIPKINSELEKINGEFLLRLHPHTWRNYNNKILNAIRDYPRISLSTEKDIYKTLNDYSIMITDYSSIAYDFLITQKPLIFFAWDLETFQQTDDPFNSPYKENCPGDVTNSWEETIEAIEVAYKNPQHNAELREKLLDKFFPTNCNDINNSERIVNELKNRLGLIRR